MAASRRLVAAATALLLARGAAAQSTITHAPYYQGMYVGPNSVETINCGTDDTWVTKSGNGQCCATVSDCAIASACVDSVLFYQDGRSYTCGDGFSCAAMTVYQTSPFGGPVASQLFCAKNWSANTVYRELAVTTSDPTSPTTAPGGSATSSTPINTGDADPGQQQFEGSGDNESQAWIAGPVVGGIALVAILGGLAFWYGRRAGRKRNPTMPPTGPVPDTETGTSPMPPHSPYGAPSTNAGTPFQGYPEYKGHYWQGSTPASNFSPTPPSTWTGAGSYGYAAVPQTQHPTELPTTVPVEMSGESAPGAGVTAELDSVSVPANQQPGFAPYRA